MIVETEEKFLNPTYVETRVRELKEIRTREYAYTIDRSNRENSKTIYVRFYKVNKVKGEERFFGEKQLRISDHYLQDKYCVQFIIKENMPLTKGRKSIFMRTLQNCIKLCKQDNLKHQLGKLD